MSRRIMENKSVFYVEDSIKFYCYEQLLGPLRYSGYTVNAENGDTWVCHYVFPKKGMFVEFAEATMIDQCGGAKMRWPFFPFDLEKRGKNDYS